MKHTRLTATGAAAVIAAGLAIAAAAPASAAPAKAERITSAEQLRASLAEAIAAERTQSGPLGTNVVGRASAPTGDQDTGTASASGAVPC